jgi:hypothetical protein
LFGVVATPNGVVHEGRRHFAGHLKGWCDYKTGHARRWIMASSEDIRIRIEELATESEKLRKESGETAKQSEKLKDEIAKRDSRLD